MKFVIIFDTYALGVINLLPAFVKIKISFFIEKMIKIISQLIQKTIQFWNWGKPFVETVY